MLLAPTVAFEDPFAAPPTLLVEHFWNGSLDELVLAADPLLYMPGLAPPAAAEPKLVPALGTPVVPDPNWPPVC